jgi:energy-coupling factor transporter ATP-binding protein EcfA2
MNPSSTLPSAQDTDIAALKGISQLAYITAELEALETTLRAASHWRPAKVLLAELAWCQGKLAQISASWGHKLVVALVGPSGAGKSTLLNVLAGRELSATGRERPTTRQVVIYTRSMADAEDLLQHCGADRVLVETDYQAQGLEHLILVDTPDTNTLPENQELLARVLERADLLLAIFPAHNPKMHDNIAFLRPYVRQLPADAVIPVLNWVDRVPRQELEGTILPDFRGWIAREWGLTSTDIYLISAKASTRGVAFPEDERPLHDLNQMQALRAFLFASLNQGSQVSDRRLARAEHLLELFKSDCRREVAKSTAARVTARAGLEALDRQASQALHGIPLQTGQAAGLHAAFYTALGQRWWGPVGWLIMAWALILRLGSSVGHLLRPSLFGSLGRKASPEQEALALVAPELAAWAGALEQVHAEQWPPVADALVAAGFEASVRQPAFWEEWAQQRGEILANAWSLASREHMNRLTDVFSSWPMQLLFNAPVLTMIGWMGVQTVTGFFQQHYLTVEYFRHGAIATAIVWLASYIALQIIISFALRGSIKRALRKVLAAEMGAAVPLSEQFAAIEALERACSE